MEQSKSNKSYTIRWSLKTDYQIQVPADISEEEALNNFMSDKYADMELLQLGDTYADNLELSTIEHYGEQKWTQN